MRGLQKPSCWPRTPPESLSYPSTSVHLSPLLIFLQEKILNHLSTLRRDRDKIQGCQAKGEADVTAALVSGSSEMFSCPECDLQGDWPSIAGSSEAIGYPVWEL